MGSTLKLCANKLFFNYIVFASEWEEENKCFLDYRMIHNLKPNLLIDSQKFRDEVNMVEKEYKNLALMEGKIRKYKEPDPLFEDSIFQ